MSNSVLAIMDDLRGCLCAALEETTGGAACFCGTYPGAITNADFCSCGTTGGGCGMAWVRLDRVFPSRSFPTPDTTTTNCGSMLAAVIEVGVYRCVPAMDPQGNPPSAVAQAQAVLTQTDDMYAMHKALTCCDALTKRPVILGTYTPRDGGGCGGGAWPVTVQLKRLPS